MALPAFVALVAGSLVAAPVGGLDPPAREPPTLNDEAFLDGGAWRLLRRHEPARADARTRATFIDVATGRAAPVTVGSEAVVVVDERGLRFLEGEADVSVLRALMPSRGILLVRSARPGEDGAALAARLADAVASGRITEAVPDLSFAHARADIDIPPNDTRYESQYFLEKTHIEGAWAHSIGDADTLIVIADNGCDLTHPDLAGKLEPGFDPFEEDDDPSWKPGDGAEHGTACAGLAAASTDNDIDIAGACPECHVSCARLLPADDEIITVASDVLTFQFALDVDASVVSNSWGFVQAIPVPAPLRVAIETVQQTGRGGRGAVVVFAAGNDGRTIGDDELLAVAGVLGVGAVSNIGEPTQYTNSGASVDVVAPTGSVALDIAGPEGAGPGDVTTSFGGTSSAAPIVSGIAALVASAAPDLTADEINDVLMGTAKQSLLADPDASGHDPIFGFGLVQADRALERALGLEEPDPDAPGGTLEPDDNVASCAAAPGAGSALLLGLLALLRPRMRRQRKHP